MVCEKLYTEIEQAEVCERSHALPTAQPKPRPRLLDRRDSKAAIAKIDRLERKKCRERSGGQCEVRSGFIQPGQPPAAITVRCIHRASHNHHLRSGIGRRNRGTSILAAHRLEVCEWCHAEIHGHVLKPMGNAECAASVWWERVK